MRHKILAATTVLLILGMTACGESGPKVGEPPEPSPTAAMTAEASASPVDETTEEAPEPEDDAVETMVSSNESYRMNIIGDWIIEHIESDLPGYPDDEVDDPPEVWQITHPDVELVGEIHLGTKTTPTAPRPLFVLESMTEEALPELSSQYGNAYLVEGLFESAGEEFYRATIVTDHRPDREISEAQEYFGDRVPAPRFFLLMHSLDPESFDDYRQSQARQDLLEMLRTLQIDDPEYSREGVDLEDSDLFDETS